MASPLFRAAKASLNRFSRACSRPMSQSAFGRGASVARRTRDRSRSGSVSHSRRVLSPELDTSVLPSGLKASEKT
jgi:hypothetical protein